MAGGTPEGAWDYAVQQAHAAMQQAEIRAARERESYEEIRAAQAVWEKTAREGEAPDVR